MLYRILHPLSRLFFPLYVRSLHQFGRDGVPKTGPLILAANHPNSFLDAILLCTLFKKPVTSLTRGDVFQARWAKRLLHQLNMLPVYRAREGAEHLGANYNTFEQCVQILQQEGIVLIFSEGSCTNEWKLRALKKGTARLALQCWEKGIPVSIVPTGINYHAFRGWGKRIHLHFGQPISSGDLPPQLSDGQAHQFINQRLREQLTPMVYVAEDANDPTLRRRFFPSTTSSAIWLAVPAWIGGILHAPLAWLIHRNVTKLTTDNDHHDSLLVGLAFVAYPIWILLLMGVAAYWLPIYFIILLPLLSYGTAIAWLHYYR